MITHGHLPRTQSPDITAQSFLRDVGVKDSEAADGSRYWWDGWGEARRRNEDVTNGSDQTKRNREEQEEDWADYNLCPCVELCHAGSVPLLLLSSFYTTCSLSHLLWFTRILLLFRLLFYPTIILRLGVISFRKLSLTYPIWGQVALPSLLPCGLASSLWL